ncbi:unnamed protein product [Bursaphelenchus xylophilus]|uniref:(pine wood nematode) hypothetical protein n=1 Tax=Bursaphelenchus xylophilus TaxID=6326 RepID=A0A1I7S850_BURXY|nr:unnamed protein product [Bursaphelenchus xylophilus]CAG9080571.1 unnamed protein product [Bursaphelenchus xylophilus]
MFPTTSFVGFNMLHMAQSVYPVQPVFQPLQDVYGAPTMAYGVQLALPVFYQPTVVLPQRPVEFLPQGNHGQTSRRNGDFSAESACWESTGHQEASSTSSSPCFSQESSSGYSSDSDIGSSPGLVQYRFRKGPPAEIRLPIFEAIHRKGLRELQDRQRIPQNGQNVPCTEGKSNMPEEKRLPRRFKTVLCKHFMAGECRDGDDCKYAHGEEELRVPELPKNYKTRPCVNFMLKNYCPLGKKCDFIH